MTTLRTDHDARLLAFVGEVVRLHATGLPRRDMVESVRQSLARLIVDGTWLPAWARVASPERYLQHVLYVAPDRRFSVVALVWDPGQATPIHDHVTWCVVGVLEGQEGQIRYHLVREASARFLVESGREIAPAGHCSSLVPPAENIHKVMNDGATRAISIHVYGADIEALGTSINQRFDGLPIREPMPDLAARAWREESNLEKLL